MRSELLSFSDFFFKPNLYNSTKAWRVALTLASEDAPWPEACRFCSHEPHVCSWVKRGRGGDAREGRGGFFFMSTLQHLCPSSKPVVKAFSSAKHFSTINLYKPFLHSLSFSIFLSDPLPLSVSPFSQSSWSCHGFSLVWPLALSLSHWMEARPALQQAVDLVLFLWA